jgi:pSer/pThr/pTyr-binding forkhead associated (FHA) protein
MAALYGYLRSDLQALPLVAGRAHRIGRKPDLELVLRVRPPPARRARITCRPVVPKRAFAPPQPTASACHVPTPCPHRHCAQSRSVSGEHGVIDVDESAHQASLRDLASLNGCFINNVRLKGQGSKRLVAQASEEGYARKLEADADRSKLESRLGELARIGMANQNAGRAKAAEFVVERLQGSREKTEALERTVHELQSDLREQQQLVMQYQNQARAGLLPGGAAGAAHEGSGQQLLVARLEDELREMREAFYFVYIWLTP